jgi:hypothetical protein
MIVDEVDRVDLMEKNGLLRPPSPRRPPMIEKLELWGHGE